MANSSPSPILVAGSPPQRSPTALLAGPTPALQVGRWVVKCLPEFVSSFPFQVVTGPKLALARQEGVTSLRKEMVTMGRQELVSTGGRQEILARGGTRQEVLSGAGVPPKQELVTAPRQVNQQSMNAKYQLVKERQMRF